MPFQFRFATILQLRRRQRDEAGAEVGKAHEAISRIDQQSEEIQAQRQALREENDQERMGDVTVEALLAKGRYDLQLQADLQALSDTRRQLEHELDRRQQALVATEVEVQRYERLEEKERVAAQTEALRRQQAEADDATAIRYTILQQQQKS